jgi:hypothetical protein
MELRAEGLSYRKIAEILNISKETCVEWNKKFEKQISDLSLIKIEEIMSKYSLLKETRLISLGKTLRKIDEVLLNISLDKVELKDLLDFKLKYSILVGKETNQLDIIVEDSSDKEANILSKYLNRVIKHNTPIKIEFIDASNDERIKMMEKQIDQEIVLK